MKVKELIEQLEKQDPELEILCFSEDEDILPEGEAFRMFKVESVTDTGVVNKDDANQPAPTSGRTPIAENNVTILITSDF